MSDIPQTFTADYYEEQYFAGTKGGKRFLRPNGKIDYWSYFNPDGNAPAYAEIVDAWKTVFEPKSMLDAGAGRGGLVSYAREAGIEAYGFDWSRWAVNEGRFRNCKPEWLLEHDATKPLPYGDGRFDLVTAIDLLEHIYVEDLKCIVSEFYRVAKGFLFLEIDTVDGFKEQGYVIRKGEPHDVLREANMAAGHVTVCTPAFWMEQFDNEDWILRRDLEHWFYSLVHPDAVRNWLLNTVLVYSKLEP